VQLTPGQHTIRVIHKRRQQIGFTPGQLERSVAHVSDARTWIELDP
jgi:hypothetical protein